MKNLIIGCGNIGALYDFDNDEILTHAKALESLGRSFDVFDTNKEILNRVAEKYNATPIESMDNLNYFNYDTIHICTPTQHHFDYLKNAIESGVRQIICEKPISLDRLELDRLRVIYSTNSSRVFVNYIRRFTPAFEKLKIFIKENIKSSVVDITIRYNRGFINFGSHAWDTLSFLFDTTITVNNIAIDQVIPFKDNDPILCGKTSSNIGTIHLDGIIDDGPIFNIVIRTSRYEINITNDDQKIECISINQSSEERKVVLLIEETLSNYMEKVLKMQLDARTNDNFIASLDMTKDMLSIINNIKQ